MAVLCGNEGHLDEMDELPPAVVKLTWPDGRFKPTTACNDCLDTLIIDYVLYDENDGQRHPLLIEPVEVDQ
jgi:hypothetical protein